MGNLNLRVIKDVAIIEFDQPDSRVNVLNTETMKELGSVLEQVSNKSGLEALIIASRKEGIFIAGADIKEIECIGSAEEAIEKAEEGKKILNKLSSLNLISIAAINGACLGGGLELALACKYRVANFSNKVKIGLPEVKLGIVPGFGGTQRLPRLIGLSKALTMILSGEVISSNDALKYSLVDRLFPDVSLIDDALSFARGILDGKIEIKRKKKKSLLLRFLEDSPFGRGVLFNQAKRNVLKRSRGFYPAPIKAIELIKRTYDRDIARGFVLESKAFGELAITDVSKNLIKVFYLDSEFKKFQWVSPDVKPSLVRKCGVVGAGVMGGGIAQLVSFNDIPVRLKDINYEALKTALKTASGLFKYALKKKKLKKNQVDYKLGLISPTITYKGFENSELVIEAVVEDLNIKQKVFNELSEITRSHNTILASNTSSLPIGRLAEHTSSPERIVGLHFFNPVHRMPLVEVIRSDETSEQAVATAIEFARRLGKVVIVVKDVPGFLINRILLSYLNEAGFLIEDGMRIERIDRIVYSFGMPMGPLELVDEIGIDVGYKVARILEDSYGKRMEVAPILKRVRDKGLLGKKMKTGFYLHKGKKKIPNSDIYALLKPKQRQVSGEDALKRMIYLMINEAARCLEEGVVERPHTIDIGMIMGTGFPPFRGGLLRYADSVGIGNIVNDLRNFKEELAGGGERFEPCNYLLDMAGKNKTFY